MVLLVKQCCEYIPNMNEVPSGCFNALAFHRRTIFCRQKKEICERFEFLDGSSGFLIMLIMERVEKFESLKILSFFRIHFEFNFYIEI